MTQPLTVIFRFLQTVRRCSVPSRHSLSRRARGCVGCRVPTLPPCPAPLARAPACQRTRIAVWLYEQSSLRIEGRIIGFDEFMNLVLDDAEEVPVAKGAAPAGPRRALGRILLKGALLRGLAVRRRSRGACVCARASHLFFPLRTSPPPCRPLAGDNVTLIRAVVVSPVTNPNPSSSPAPEAMEA